MAIISNAPERKLNIARENIFWNKMNKFHKDIKSNACNKLLKKIEEKTRNIIFKILFDILILLLDIHIILENF